MNIVKTCCLLLAAASQPIPACLAASSTFEEHGSLQPQAAELVDMIAQDSWNWVLQTDSGQRDAAGLPFIGLTDIDFAQTERDAAMARNMLAQLRKVDPAALDNDHLITWKFLLKFHQDIANGPENWIYDFAITPYRGVLPLTGLIEFASKRPLASEAERQEYLLLVTEIGDLLDQMSTKTRKQAEAGIFLPKPAIPSLISTYQGISATAAEKLQPASARLGTLPAAERQNFLQQTKAAIDARITPGFASILAVFDEGYQSKAPMAIGLSQYPGGAERYQRAITTFTTTQSTPDELFAIGESVSSELQTKLAAIRHKLGFKGTQAEFHQMLETDPRFRVSSPEALEALYREQINRVKPHVPQFFKRLPNADYGIRRIPEINEGGVAFGYYEKPSSVEPLGLFRYNGANLDKRGLVQAAAINFHELIPGHHFHIALQA